MHHLRRNRGFTSIGTTSTVLMAVNPKRFAVVISAPATNRVTLDFGGPAVLDSGITLYPSTDVLVLNYWTIGDAIHEDIFAIANALAQNIGWMEIFFD